jgi:hypothetical protein
MPVMQLRQSPIRTRQLLARRTRTLSAVSKRSGRSKLSARRTLRGAKRLITRPPEPFTVLPKSD